jgi:hypothetical protein
MKLPGPPNPEQGALSDHRTRARGLRVQRIQNRAAGRIGSLLAEAQSEVESRALWNKLWGSSVSENGLVASVDPSDMKSVWRIGRERQAAAQAVGSSAIGQRVYKTFAALERTLHRFGIASRCWVYVTAPDCWLLTSAMAS